MKIYKNIYSKKCSILFMVAFCFASQICFSQTGFLYGTSYYGGTYNYGTIFRYNIAKGTDTVLLNFDSVTNGAFPLAALIQAKDGMLYSTTYEGGSKGFGTVFRYNPLTGKDTVLVNFDSVHGAFPFSNLMQAKNGIIYGTTVNGGKRFGTIFSLDTVSLQFKYLYVFDSVTGSFPWDGLVEAPNGLLYGTTNSGGKYNDGVIFCFNPLTGKDSTCFNFDSASGMYPDGSLCTVNDSLLIDMANSGGKYNYGTLYSYNILNGHFRVLVNFNDTNGAYAFSNVIQATNGLVYGLTEGGGSYTGGALFSYDPTNGKDSVWANLQTPTGDNSFASLIQAPDGIMYGVTAYGGSAGYGVIFSFDPVSHTYTRLFDFSTSNTGETPNGSLLYVNNVVSGTENVAANASSIKVFPNPVDKEATIEINGPNDGTIILYDLQGNIADYQLIVKSSIRQYKTLNTSNLPSGTYLLKAGNAITKLVVEH